MPRPMPRFLLLAPVAFLTAGCVMDGDPVVAPSACPVSDSRDWTAFVNAMPGPDARPELIVSGTVVLPTAGYTVGLRPGPADLSAQPVQTVQLVAIPPDGPAATVLSEVDVRLSMPSLAVQPGEGAPYRGVQIFCEGAELAFITPVETAW